MPLNAASTLRHIFLVHMTGLVLQKTQSVPFCGTRVVLLSLLHRIAQYSVTSESGHALAAAAARLVQTHGHGMTASRASFALVHIDTNSPRALVALGTVTPEAAILIDTHRTGWVAIVPILITFVDI